jgi:hypothetical protein
MICIFGASGNTGGAAAAFLLKRGKKIRVVGQQREKLAPLAKAGAESCVGDIENAGFVREALSGAEAAYLLVPPNMATNDFRAYQNRVIDALTGGIEAAGVRHVVLPRLAVRWCPCRRLSRPSPRKCSRPPIDRRGNSDARRLKGDIPAWWGHLNLGATSECPRMYYVNYVPIPGVP